MSELVKQNTDSLIGDLWQMIDETRNQSEMIIRERR